MSYTFVVGDIHGKFSQLYALLNMAGIVDDNERRINWEDRVVSIGDLANAVREDINGDEECLKAAAEWFDVLILGNHESGWLFSGITFNGFVPTPHLRSLYNSYYRDGLVKPAELVGDTLLTHAGVHMYFQFATGQEAYDAIMDVWENYNVYRDDYDHKFEWEDERGQIAIPKALLLDAVSKARGGSVPFGGILWSDWSEPKNINFPQVVGHTPISGGPVITKYRTLNTFTLDIDTGAKHNGVPWGVWLDEDGRITSYVSVAMADK